MNIKIAIRQIQICSGGGEMIDLIKDTWFYVYWVLVFLFIVSKIFKVDKEFFRYNHIAVDIHFYISLALLSVVLYACYGCLTDFEHKNDSDWYLWSQITPLFVIAFSLYVLTIMGPLKKGEDDSGRNIIGAVFCSIFLLGGIGMLKVSSATMKDLGYKLGRYVAKSNGYYVYSSVVTDMKLICSKKEGSNYIIYTSSFADEKDAFSFVTKFKGQKDNAEYKIGEYPEYFDYFGYSLGDTIIIEKGFKNKYYRAINVVHPSVDRINEYMRPVLYLNGNQYDYYEYIESHKD